MKADSYSSRMLYSTSIKVANIPASRIEDSAFWCVRGLQQDRRGESEGWWWW